ncbi:MAG: hypothetical protein VX210_03880 [Myxococcota bacterium]|nr:hypothetical protein [Myxococcota bacterium]
MHWTKNFSSLTLFLLGAACASSPDVASLPSWCERAGLGGAAGQTSYTGRADGAASADEALKLARANALAQLTGELGITVSAESSLVQSETNGQLSTEVRAAVTVASQEVEIRGLRLASRATASLDDGETGCVTVEISAGEKRRLERLARNRSLLTVHCVSESLGQGSCDTSTVSQLNALLTARGAKLLPSVETAKVSATTFQNALTADAAKVIEVSIAARPLDVINGEHYAEASLSFKQIDSVDQSTFLSLETGPQKGGHYSTRDAELAAVNEALQVLQRLLSDHQL